MEYYFLTNADCAKRVSIPASGLPTDFLKKYMVKFANATHLIAVEGDFTIRIEWTDSFIAVGRVLLVENEKLVDFDYDQSKV